MPLYSSDRVMDDPVAVDRDRGFIGFQSRVDASSLSAGIAAYAENQRFINAEGVTRLGCAKVNDTFLTFAPLTVPLVLPASKLVTSITRSSTTATVTLSNHGYSNNQRINIRGAGQAEYNGDFIITVINAGSFSYTVSGSPATPATGVIYANGGPVASDAYDDGVWASCVWSDPANEEEWIVLATQNRAWLWREGEAMVPIDYPSGQTVEEGDPCFVVQAFNYVYLFRGDALSVLRWDGNPANDFVAVPSGAHSSGGTFIKMPNADYGLWFRNRMFLPYERDEVIESDILDADTYDTQYSQFKIADGTADYLVRMHPYQQNAVLVFFRRSIHLITDVDLTPANQASAMITNEFGLLGDRSVVTAGQYVFFLSDAGVQALEAGLELKLRGASEPLSKPIQDIIDRVNFAHADKAYGIFFANRYYLSVPLDGATRPNALLVYNILNKEWESVDTFQPFFYLDSLLVKDYQGTERLFAVNREGGVYLMEEQAQDDFGDGSYDVEGILRTRRYTFGEMDNKKFLRASANVLIPSGADLTATYEMENPDVTGTMSLTVTDDEASIARARIGRKAYGCQLVFNTTGQVTVRSTQLDATLPGSKYLTQG